MSSTTELPPFPTTSTTISTTGRKKVSDLVPEEWKRGIIALEEAQSFGQIFGFSGVIADITSNDAYGNRNKTVKVCVPDAMWFDFAGIYFPILEQTDPEHYKEETIPFKLNVERWGAGYVCITMKAGPDTIGNVLQWEGFPKVRIFFTVSVYPPFGKVKESGISFKIGYLEKL